MQYIRIKPKDFIQKYSSTPPPPQRHIQSFQAHLQTMLTDGAKHHLEKSQEQELNECLRKSFDYKCRSRDAIDSAILVDGIVSVIIECKSLKNSQELPIHDHLECDLSSKAFAESILYYLRERSNRNNSIKHIILCNLEHFYIIDAWEYERVFHTNKDD